MSAPATWRVVIADDEPLARTRLRGLLQRHAAFEVVAECATGEAVLAAIDAQAVDVLFLDIRMPALDGVQVVESLLAQERPGALPAIVFVTAYDVHAAHAFDLDAVDYLVKPVDIDRFDRAIERVQAHLERRATAPAAAADEREHTLAAALDVLARLAPATRFPARFPVRDPRGIYFVATSDVERVEADGNYVALVAGGRRHLVRETMRKIEQRLDPERFVRVHRSAIVRIDCIRRLEPWGHGEYQITLSDGTRLTSSRTCGDAIKRLMQ